jgi:NADH-quinone oxidoreductase subunit L
MVTGIGIGATNAALFHLTTHAFFKAGLFLCAGAVIHYLHHNQDIRKMGNLRKRMPIIFWSFGICSAALAGLPFFSGYLSKDALLISAFSWADAQSSDVYFLIPLTAVFASALTAYYITRLYILVFFDRQGSTMKAIVKSVVNTYTTVTKGMQAVVSAEEMGFQEKMFSNFIRSIGPMEAAVMVMAFGSLFIPFSLNPFSMENSSFGTTFPVDLSEKYHWVGYAMLLISLISIWLSYTFSKEEVGRIRNGTAVYGESNWIARFAQNHFYINTLYRFIFVKPLTGTSEKGEELAAQSETASGISHWLNHFDRVWVDGIINRLASLLIRFAAEIRNFEQVVVDKSITLISESAGSLGKLTQQLQAGRVQSYIISLIAGLILLIMLLFVLGN